MTDKKSMKDQDKDVTEAFAKAAAAGAGHPGMLGALFDSASQLMSATMVRAQLERIADAMELDIILQFMRDIVRATGQTNETEERIVEARSFLRDKILARIEREMATARTAAKTE